MGSERKWSISLVIVDLDDTLVSFDGVSEQSWIEACKRHYDMLCGFNAESVAQAIRTEGEMYWDDPERHRIGRLNLPYTRRKIVASAMQDLGITDSVAPSAVADTYATIRLEAMYLFDGATEALLALRESGFRLALLTNGDSIGQRQKIERFSLSQYFDGVYIEEEIRYGKPEPAAFQRILDDFDTAPVNTAIIGDNYEWEIRIPAAMGMLTFWVNPQGRMDVPENGPQPERSLSSIAELVPALRELLE